GQYRDSSRGAISWSGTIVGSYQLTATTADPCALVTWANAIDAQAAAAGVDVASYPHKVYVLPYVNACAAAGVGSIGGTPTYAWILSCNNSAEGLFAHELGHNLGMDHSATDENGTINEY